MLFFSNPHTRAPLFIPTDQKTPPCRWGKSQRQETFNGTFFSNGPNVYYIYDATTSKQLKHKKNKMDEKEERPSCVSVRCCPKQWPCTTRVRQRRDEEEKASCDCTDMILNDRVCIGTKLTCLGANDRKEARPQPSMPEEVHIGHYILSRVCSCCGISVSEKEGECGDGGGGTTCAWLDVKPVGHGLFDAASVLEALYQPWANDGRVCIPLFAPPNFLEEDELEAMAKKGEKTPHLLGCVKIGCSDEEEGVKKKKEEEEGDEDEDDDEESCNNWDVQVKKEVYLDFHIFVRESKVRKRGHYVSHMTSSLRITLNDVTIKLVALMSFNYEEHVNVKLDADESRPVLLTMLTTHVRQICTRSGFAATYRLSGVAGKEELLWGRCCNRYMGWVSEFKLKQRSSSLSSPSSSSSSSEGMYLASYVVTGGGQICHHDGVICDDDDDDDNKDKAAKIAAVAATSSAFSTFLGKEAEMSHSLFSRGAAQLQLYFREDGSIKLVDARNELMHEKLERRRKGQEEEEEEDLLAAWTKSLQEIFEESMRLVDFGLSQEIKDAPTAAQEEERRKVMEEQRLAKRRKRDSLKVEAVRLTVDDEDKWRSLTSGGGDVEWLMACSGVSKQRLHAVRMDLRRKEVEANSGGMIEASYGMPRLVSITSLGVEPTVARKVTRMRRGKEEGGKKGGTVVMTMVAASRSGARTERCCLLRARWDRAWRSRCRTLSGGAATKSSTTARSPTRRTRSGRRCGTTRRHLEASVLSASLATL